MWPAGYPGTQHPFKIHGVEKSKKFAGHITVKLNCKAFLEKIDEKRKVKLTQSAKTSTQVHVCGHRTKVSVLEVGQKSQATELDE